MRGGAAPTAKRARTGELPEDGALAEPSPAPLSLDEPDDEPATGSVCETHASNDVAPAATQPRGSVIVVRMYDVNGEEVHINAQLVAAWSPVDHVAYVTLLAAPKTALYMTSTNNHAVPPAIPLASSYMRFHLPSFVLQPGLQTRTDKAAAKQAAKQKKELARQEQQHAHLENIKNGSKRQRKPTAKACDELASRSIRMAHAQ